VGKLFLHYLTFSGCKANVIKTLKELSGVKNVDVDLDSKQATIDGDESFDLETAVKKVIDAGYEARVY
jgi:copper chaperone CopZ